MNRSYIYDRLFSRFTKSSKKPGLETEESPQEPNSCPVGDPDAIIVYTLPKTGQSTIFQSCRQLYPQLPIFRTQNLWGKREITTFLEDKNLENVAVLTGVREPVSWALSYIVQEVKRLEPQVIAKYNAGEMSSNDVANYVRQFIENRGIFQFYTNWFDNQISKFVGVDVLEDRLDFERKKLTIEEAPYRVLCFRNEDPEGWPGLLSDFFGKDNVPMKVANVALFKDYSLFYYEAIMGISFPEDFLDKLYSSRVVRTFYTDFEVDAFKRRWAQPMPGYYAAHLRDVLKKVTAPEFENIRRTLRKGPPQDLDDAQQNHDRRSA